MRSRNSPRPRLRLQKCTQKSSYRSIEGNGGKYRIAIQGRVNSANLNKFGDYSVNRGTEIFAPFAPYGLLL